MPFRGLPGAETVAPPVTSHSCRVAWRRWQAFWTTGLHAGGTWDLPVVLVLGPGSPPSREGRSRESITAVAPAVSPSEEEGHSGSAGGLSPETAAVRPLLGSVSGEGGGSDRPSGSEGHVGRAFTVLWPRRDAVSLHLTVPHPRPLGSWPSPSALHPGRPPHRPLLPCSFLGPSPCCCGIPDRPQLLPREFHQLKPKATKALSISDLPQILRP